MSVPPGGEALKRAAVDLDELADKRLSEISAADFLRALEQAEAAARHRGPEEATLGTELHPVRVGHGTADRRSAAAVVPRCSAAAPQRPTRA